jgi:hypothetical protein
VRCDPCASPVFGPGGSDAASVVAEKVGASVAFSQDDCERWSLLASDYKATAIHILVFDDWPDFAASWAMQLHLLSLEADAAGAHYEKRQGKVREVAQGIRVGWKDPTRGGPWVRGG